MDDEKWGEDLVAFFLVMRAAMMLRPIVTAVGGARAPKISKLFLFVSVT